MDTSISMTSGCFHMWTTDALLKHTVFVRFEKFMAVFLFMKMSLFYNKGQCFVIHWSVLRLCFRVLFYSGLVQNKAVCLCWGQCPPVLSSLCPSAWPPPLPQTHCFVCHLQSEQPINAVSRASADTSHLLNSVWTHTQTTHISHVFTTHTWTFLSPQLINSITLKRSRLAVTWLRGQAAAN